MSDSDSDDFGTLGPTTPLIPVKRKAARTNKTANRAVPRPSSKPTPGAAKEIHNNAKTTSSEHSDIEELKFIDDHEDPHEDVEDIQQTRKRKPSSRSEVTAVNVQQAVKGKGKAKANPPKPTRKIAPTSELVVVDDIQIIEDANTETRGTRAINALKNKRSNTTFRPAKNDSASKELERFRRKAADAEGQIAALSTQLEECFRVRNTESEQLLKRQAAQYESQIQTLEELIKELYSQLARTEPLTRSGNSSVLHLLTREAADEEKRLIEKELVRWKDVSKEKDGTIMDKDSRIAELEQAEKDLRCDLRAEIERSSALASKTTRGRTGHGVLADDPKQVEIIKFYEDLTNLLVPSMKFQPAKNSGLDEWTFTCIYTYLDVDDTSANDDGERKGKSLNFTLRFCYDGEPEPRSVQYIPLELDKESVEFVEKLEFLGTSFTFKRDQLSLFFKTVYNKMGGESQDDEDGSEQDGSEQMLNGQEFEDEDMDDVQIVDR